MENKIQNLVQHVSIISKKYDDIAKITGENFNVFSVMSMESDERFTHSAIIGELLNPKGSHSQGSVFLKLFVEEISSLKEIENFDFENAKVIIEEHIGLIDEKYSKGGFIDIVLKDNNNVIVIENKIYAGDQKNQLVRYKNHYPDGKMLYLNLFGDEPSKDSSGNLIIDTDFHIISYKTEIINWLEKCHKETVDQPIIRETIKQYLNLVKKLTNQTINNKMSEEIIKMILKDDDNLKSSIEIYNSVNTIKNNIINRVKNLVNMSEEDKSLINLKIKEVFNDGFLTILPLWQEPGYKLIRYDVVMKPKPIDHRIMFQVEARETEIHFRFWSHDKDLERKIKEIQNGYLFNNKFDYFSSDEEIYSELKRQILLVLDFLKQ
jgi:hypothetical protein